MAAADLQTAAPSVFNNSGFGGGVSGGQKPVGKPGRTVSSRLEQLSLTLNVESSDRTAASQVTQV